MHQQSDVKVAKIEKLVTRQGFSDRFRRVTVEWVDHGLVHSSFQVWVSPAYPEANLDRVACTFLWRQLPDLAELAKAGAFSEQDVGYHGRGAAAIRLSRERSTGATRARSGP